MLLEMSGGTMVSGGRMMRWNKGDFKTSIAAKGLVFIYNTDDFIYVA